MIIKSLRMQGFKGFKEEFYIEFDDVKTVIEGDNFQGKTSIGEAICWCLLGCNLNGNDKTLNIVNNKSANAYCEMNFIDNEGNEHIVIRTKGRENIVLLDGKRANVEMLSKYFVDKKVFLSVYNPYYFMNLEPKDQRELLRGILPTIDYRDAFNLLSQSEREILVEPRINLNEFIKNARAELKNLKKEQDNLEGKKQYANIIANTDVGQEGKFNKEGLLMALNNEYELNLKSTTGNTKNDIKLRIEELDKRINKHNELLYDLRQKYKELKNIIDSAKENSSVCPVCNSKILDNEKIKEIIEIQIRELNSILKKGKETEIEVNNLKAQKDILESKYNELSPNNDKENLLNNLKDRISQLNLEKENILKNNYEVQTKIRSVEKAKNDISIFNKALEEVKSTQIILNNQISTAISLNNLIIKKQMEMVKKHLNKVELIFSKVNKSTGEIEDDYKILYDGKEFNILSLSEKIKAVLEITNLINKLVGFKSPIFIDNSESITHYDNDFDNQIILAKVVEGKKLLMNKKLRLVG